MSPMKNALDPMANETQPPPLQGQPTPAQSSGSYCETKGEIEPDGSEHHSPKAPTMKEAQEEEGEEHGEEHGEEDEEKEGESKYDCQDENLQKAMEISKKKKKSRGSKRGPTALPKNRGTGFEEYFADPPMTPEEHMTEKNEVYSQDFPFQTRMQACIQRFRSRRRLQGDLTLYFNEYLFLGGVDTSPDAFGGLDPKELKELTPAQRRERMATDIIHDGSAAGDRFYNGDDENWSVDFAGVAAGFLSNTLVELTGLEPDGMNAAIEVVENFLRYVLHHEACPEYEDDVKRALQVCGEAREEWPMVAKLQSDLPGDFNLAAAEFLSRTRSDDWSFHDYKRRDNFDPKAVFYSAIAMMDDSELFDQFCSRDKTDCQIAKEFDCTLEVMEIQRPVEAVVQRFREVVFNTGGDDIRLPPIGKVVLRPAVIEDDWVDFTKPRPLLHKRVTLFFEDHILASMKPGMKMTLRIAEMTGGLYLVQTIRKLVPSFCTFLPQEMMRHFKRPRANNRPAPSIHDANVDAEAGGDE